MSDKDKPAAPGDAEAPSRAKVILPKVQKHEGGYRPAGPGGERLTGRHNQTHDRKPPRLPSRHGS